MATYWSSYFMHMTMLSVGWIGSYNFPFTPLTMASKDRTILSFSKSSQVNTYMYTCFFGRIILTWCTFKPLSLRCNMQCNSLGIKNTMHACMHRTHKYRSSLLIVQGSITHLTISRNISYMSCLSILRVLFYLEYSRSHSTQAATYTHVCWNRLLFVKKERGTFWLHGGHANIQWTSSIFSPVLQGLG